MRTVLARAVRVVSLFLGIIFLPAANAEAQTVNYRSIGSSTLDLSTGGLANATFASTTVTFVSGLLPASIGMGDELEIGGLETLHILSRDTHTQVTVQTPVQNNHANASFTIRRAFNDLQAWEDARQAANGNDLVVAGAREVGVVYNDGGNVGSVFIDGSTTNTNYYFMLTVAKAHRHNGTNASGAQVGSGGIIIGDDYTVVEWLVSTSATSNAVTIQAANVSLSNLILSGAIANGVLVDGASDFIIRNSVLSGCSTNGIGSAATGSVGLIENCSLYQNSQDGVAESGGDLFTVTNTISIGNVGSDFIVDASRQSHNISGDNSAQGPNSQNFIAANSVWVLPGSDMHLIGTAPAIDAGLDLSSFRDDIDAQRRPVGSAWDIGADELTSANVFLRSIGPRLPETNLHTIAVVNGSPVVIGTGTTWRADNRGRGDRMTIVGIDYTVSFVESDTELTLTTPFIGTSGASVADYEIARKFSNLTAWEDCIDGAGNGGTCAPFSEVTSSLILDNRSEVGIVYDDGLQYDRFVIDGSSTDALHSIRLTADGDNRHYGLATQGVVIDPVGAGLSAIEIMDEFVTLEWLRITGVDVTGHGVYVNNLEPPDNRITLKDLLIYNVIDDGIRIGHGDANALLFNNIIYSCRRGISITQSLNATALVEIYNNTVYNCTDQGGILTTAPQLNSNIVLLKNNIAHSNLTVDFNIAPVSAIHPNSCNNLSSDGTGPPHSLAGGGLDEPNLTLMNFVDTNLGFENLHILAGSAAENQGVDLDSMFRHDIDGNGRLPPWEIGADDIFAVTAVDLLRFDATGYDTTVVLEWETGSETDNAGFYVYRSESVTGPFERVSSSSVAGLGTSPVGALYRYVDQGLENGKTYYYEIEDFELSGATERHGPVWASPQAGATLPPELTEEPETSPSTGVVYGDPESVSFRELSRNNREVVLELLTGGFYAEPQGDGTVRLTVPGLIEGEPAEGPRVPVKRSWVEAIAGRGVRLVSVEAEGVEVFSGLQPVEGSSGIEVSRRGTVRAVRRRTRRRASVRGMLPEHRAQVLSTGFQGDVKKAYVELAPLRYDARRGELQLSHRLVLRLAFTGRVAEEQSMGGSRGRLSRRRSRQTQGGSVAARLGVVESGLYGVSFKELFGRRGRPIPTRWLRLSHQGEPVAFHVDGDVFGRGKKLYFVSEGAGLNPYGPEAMVELSVGVEGERMPVDGTEPAGTLLLNTYWQDVEREENLRHGATLLDEANQWFWETILNGTSGSYPFEAQGVVPSVESGRLELRLRGASPEADPEFVLRVYVNEIPVEELRWSGGESERFEVAVPPSVVVEGENTLRLEHATDGYSGILLDGFTCTYPRASVTESGRLSGTWSDTGPASVTGTLGPVVDVTQVPAVWLSEAEESETGVRFWAKSGHRYEVGVLTPEVRRAGRMRLKRPQKGADYLLIGPREFLMEAAPLLELRQGQGLTTRSISLEDVWAEFGHGEVRPEAIREFLSYAYHEWKSPEVRYVVLLGDGTYDYKDYLGYSVPNVIPPLLARTSYLWTASDPSYGWVNGEDELPDIAIGRLPVDTVEETRAVVAKLVAFGEGEGPAGPLVLVADDADHGGDFRASAEELATGVLWGEELRKIYLGEHGVTTTRESIVNAFDSGARLMSYVGHGGTRLWADEQIFDAPAVETLSPQSHQPIVLTINCYTGSFHLPYPDYDSLSEELVKVEGRGAIAAISPSGLSLNTPAHYLHRAYLEELTSGGHDRLGDAIRAAQEAYAATGALPELLTIYHLFGDPAMKIKGLE